MEKSLDEVIEYAQMIVNMIPSDGAERYSAWIEILRYLKEYREMLDLQSALPDYYRLVEFWSENHENVG